MTHNIIDIKFTFFIEIILICMDCMLESNKALELPGNQRNSEKKFWLFVAVNVIELTQ